MPIWPPLALRVGKFSLAGAALAVLYLCQPINATININTEAVQKTVVFLYAADAQGSPDKTKPVGTAFLVSIPLKSDPKRLWVVLVTARHIVDPAWAKCPIDNPTLLFMRLNKKNYLANSDQLGFDYVPLPLVEEGKPKWVHHSDEHVDVAVMQLSSKDLGQDFDLVEIPVELFPTDAELSAQSIGDPVMSAGLMPALPGIKRNYPIFKFGQISNIPAETIETRCTPQQPSFSVRVWLIAANLIPGNSGSPIFHVPLGGFGVSFGGTRAMLLGVQSVSFLGADVAGMTPVNFVFDILLTMGLPDADLHKGPSPPPTTPASK
jgi:hypothetical protein